MYPIAKNDNARFVIDLLVKHDVPVAEYEKVNRFVGI